MNRTLATMIPIGLAFAWLLWFSVQARWSEVVAPNWYWLLLAVVVGIGLLQMIVNRSGTEVEKVKKMPTLPAVIYQRDIPVYKRIIPTERVIAREVVTDGIYTRTRTIYG